MRRESFSDPATNLLDRLDASIAEQGADDALLTIVPFRPSPADVDLRVCDRAWGESVAGRRALDVLARSTDPATVSLAEGRLAARFANVRLAALGTALERGGADPLATHPVAPARRWTVNFGDPNTTKALHVGHLRNVALGNSLASAAEALGMQVVRQSRVGDFGRNMGEAMAGYLRHGGGREPGRDDVKGDHLIGDCYVRYVRELAERPSDAPDANDGDAALTREREVRRDAAEELLARWRDG
ncbi:MAG TPA: arginine--tRNA ligase, partial [Conexibacter sp.]|nr:arginine--tRNA ligase [Conexibacter sp.]